ncbi:IclR family transcriptional regulator [Vibrio sp. vnigr-6D03]|uniref:IclR family transcriptional regulator n=1 Tax=Vibrio sp. vnigr-6D03 TaxID=2058088 RepID=UPI000C32EFF3|nr:IclR family transcriptional regulator [Vibrio sp. vnigr-6D03]PKF80102.1 IclR family transcriptional regulator [Vibrio sp. vnigr-6D03]
MTTSNKREKGSTILRVLEILQEVASSEQPLSPTEVGVRLDIPKPTSHRIVNTLLKEGWLYTDLKGQLVPGDHFHNIALNVLHTSVHKTHWRAILERVAKEMDETCGIAIPDGTEMIYFDRVECEYPLRVHIPVGTRVPAWCSSSGKLYLSSLPEARRRAMFKQFDLQPMGKNSIVGPEALEQSLLGINQTQIGVDNEEFMDGMNAISVPIKRTDGRLIACLFCHAPIARKTIDHLISSVDKLRKAAQEIESVLAAMEDE